MRLTTIILERFCGFRDFSVDAGEFNVLIGPNNGGKTTVLRAVKFCTDTMGLTLGTRDAPRLDQAKSRGRHFSLANAARGTGVSDIRSLYFGRSRMESSGVALHFAAGNSKIVVRAECRAGGDDHVWLEVARDGIELHALSDEIFSETLNQLFSVQAEFVPPPATISPIEGVMQWPDIQSRLAQGHFAETWRNRLHWMYEGKDPDVFQRVVNRVQSHIPGVRLRPPKRNRQNNAVDIPYLEDGVEYDISSAGGGLRTIVTLAAAMELSDATILLFDEPDSHLHSSVQRQVAEFLQDAIGNERQFFLSSHAPDLIEEVPVESLIWIDRANPSGKRCDHSGKALVDLGAVSHTQAVAFVGADTVLYFENHPDRRTISRLMEQAGFADITRRSRMEPLHGFGDSTKLPGAFDVLKRLRNVRVAIAAILDADYTKAEPRGSATVKNGVLTIRLPCKELENLILLSPQTIADAARRDAERRSQLSGEEPRFPTCEEVNERLHEFTAAEDLKTTLKPQWVCRWAAEEARDLNNPGDNARAEREFAERWADGAWRLRCCPGKEVLKRVRLWLQREFKITVSLPLLFQCYEPDAELLSLFRELQTFIWNALGEPHQDAASSTT